MTQIKIIQDEKVLVDKTFESSNISKEDEAEILKYHLFEIKSLELFFKEKINIEDVLDFSQVTHDMVKQIIIKI